jgi:5-deoxy-glucuronate isomerase
MVEDLKLNSITSETCFVSATNRGKGRRAAVVPGQTAARYLHYGRITIDSGDAPIEFENHEHETGLICLNGEAEVLTAGQSYQLARYDSLYITRDSKIEVRPGAPGCDLAEISAPVSGKYPVRFVSYSEVRANPKLHIIAGKPPAERDLNVLIGANVEAGRIMAGVTFSTQAIGLRGRRTSTRECWKRRISSLTCRTPRSECSSFTRTRRSRSWCR